MHVEDKLFVGEVAKQREAIQEKANKPQTISSTSPNMPDVPPPFPAEAEHQSTIPKENQENQEFYQFERLIIQTIIRYGEKVMCHVEDDENNPIPISVIKYITHDLQEDDLSFHSSIHRQILSEAIEHESDPGFTAQRYFITHPDTIISRLATELASDRYQLSKFHSKTQKIVTDEERLIDLVPTLMINFKNAIVSAELKHIMFELQNPAVFANEEQCTALMKRHEELREIKRDRKSVV